MAQKSGRNKSADELRTNVRRSRERVGCDLRGLHYELDFPAKLRRSFREQTISWLAASMAVGVLTVLLLSREKKIYIDLKKNRKANQKLVETSFALGALKIGASLVRPMIVKLIKNQLTDVALQQRARSN